MKLTVFFYLRQERSARKTTSCKTKLRAIHQFRSEAGSQELGDPPADRPLWASRSEPLAQRGAAERSSTGKCDEPERAARAARRSRAKLDRRAGRAVIRRGARVGSQQRGGEKCGLALALVSLSLEELLLLVLAHLLAALLDHATHGKRFPRRWEMNRAAGSILSHRPPVKRHVGAADRLGRALEGAGRLALAPPDPAAAQQAIHRMSARQEAQHRRLPDSQAAEIVHHG
jgi:hypothetical protein